MSTDKNGNTISKRLFLDLEYIQGEEINLEFDAIEDGVAISLDEYILSGEVMEDFNNTPLGAFTFAESENVAGAWIGTIPSTLTATLPAKVYKYEIRMEHATEGRAETLFYGTITLLATRIPI